MKTTWRIINKETKEIIFIGPNGYYGEAKKYLDDHKEDKDLDIDPEMK